MGEAPTPARCPIVWPAWEWLSQRLVNEFAQSAPWHPERREYLLTVTYGRPRT